MERPSERELAKPAKVNTKLVSDPEECVTMLDSDGYSDTGTSEKGKPVTPLTPLTSSFSVCGAWESFQDCVETTNMNTIGTALRRLSKSTAAWTIRLPRTIVNGLFGECIVNYEHDKRWWFSQGMALVTLLYLGFVLFTVAGPLYKETDVSICGYLEIVPSYYVFMFCVVAAAGADATLFNIVHIVRTEMNTVVAAVQMLLGSVCAVGLIGFTAVPRCMWTVHQAFVLSWAYAGTLAMLISLIRDCKKPHYTAVPFAWWMIGVALCAIFFDKGGWGFYNAEGLCVLSYIAWCSSLHRRFERLWTCPHILGVCGFIAFAIMKLFQHNLSHCTVKAKQPQTMDLKWVLTR